jgi:hypothetical protein
MFGVFTQIINVNKKTRVFLVPLFQGGLCRLACAKDDGYRVSVETLQKHVMADR